MRKPNGLLASFPYGIQVSRRVWESLRPPPAHGGSGGGRPVLFFRELAHCLNRLPGKGQKPLSGGQLNMYALLRRVFRYVTDRYAEEKAPGALERGIKSSGFDLALPPLSDALQKFAEAFPTIVSAAGEITPPDYAGPGAEMARKREMLREFLLFRLALENPALDDFRALFDHADIAAMAPYQALLPPLEGELAKGPPCDPLSLTLPELLRAPAKASPRSLAGQIEYIRENWREILPPDLLAELLTALDIVREEEREFWGGAGRPEVLEFLRRGPGMGEYPEHERFSPDADWMPNVVLIAKMVYVWLGQLSKRYGREITRLDHIPDEELDRLARWGFTGLWLIGIWERSPASQRIKQIGGNPEAISSAYSLHDYAIAHDLGGEAALGNLRERCRQKGIRLASDMVPNHTGIYSRWTLEHPDWFIQLDYPPYPDYSFTGPDLSFSPEISLNIEDGYWDRTNAAVVFKHYDHRNGRTRYIYHGNDGTSTPWNDTAQLNYLLPEVREAVIRTIIHVARNFPIIRFDAAMTLAKKHYQRLWYPEPGHGSGVPSRAEHGMSREEFDAAFPEEFWREVVDRVAAEAPGTLLLAEAFWLMEGYFVRTLGMHRVYNSAFMNMLKMEENAKYRQTVKNVLEYDHRILQRFVNFMNNPDERTAVELFGREGKYFGAALLLVTMPGLPMFGHGQIEGFHEKYGMEYKRAYWEEPVDEHLVAGHEARIFPLMRRRRLFSGSENFVFYDFFAGEHVNEDVFAYSNRAGSERGVILYHNRYAATKGWIRTSTAIAVKEGSDTRLVRKTLGEALGLNPEGRCYYAFRDYATGLEYLRSGRELCEKGMYAELSAYQYCAFLDFREIVDDEFGNWGKLCRRLDGAPVPSVDEELKQVRFEGVISLLRELLGYLPALCQAPAEGLSAELSRRFEEFLAAVREHCNGSGDVSSVAALLARELEALAALKGLEGEAVGPFGDLMATGCGRLLLSGYLLLHRIGMVTGAEEYPARSAELVDEMGLYRPLGDAFRDAAAGEEVSPELDPSAALLLLRILTARQRFLAGRGEKPSHEHLQGLLADARVREFLSVHWSEGIEWFNRERFELLIRWLLLAATIDAGGGGKGREALEREAAAICAAAERAGYRLDSFLSPDPVPRGE